MTDAGSAEVPTLIDWAGGPSAIRRLIDAFYDRVETDDLLSAFFPGGVSDEHREHVSIWWTEVFGGPTDYTDRLGGYERMLAHHRGLAITAEQRLRFATTMSRAADDADLPGDPEFRAALIGYLEWGTRLAMANSQPDSEPPPMRRCHAGGGESLRPTDPSLSAGANWSNPGSARQSLSGQRLSHVRCALGAFRSRLSRSRRTGR